MKTKLALVFLTPNRTSGGPRRQRSWPELLLLLVLAAVGLCAAHQVPASYNIDISQAQDTATLNNFYQPEKNGSVTYRWSQPLAQIHLLPLDSRLRICLEIEENFPAIRSFTLSLETIGEIRPISQTFTLMKGEHQYCSDTAGLAAFLPGDFSTYKDGFLTNIWFGPTLQITASPYQPAGDRRLLGLLIHSVQVQSGPENGKWGFPTLLEILVTLIIVTGSWGITKTLRLSAVPGLGASLVPLAAWLSLVAFGRVELSGKIEFVLFMVLTTVVALFAIRLIVPLIFPDLVKARYYLKNGLILSPLVPLNNNHRSREPLPKKLSRFGYILGGVAFGLVLLNFGMPFLLANPDTTGWGLKHFWGLPWWVVMLLLGVAGTGTVGLIFNFSGILLKTALFKAGFKFFLLRNQNPYWWLAGCGGGAAIIFYLLRIQTGYGDSGEIISKLKLFVLYRKETGLNNFLIWREREPLDFALHFLLWRGMLNFDWWRPEYTYIFTSVLAGGVFVAVGSLVAVLLTRSWAGRCLITGLLLSAGPLLLFFGYTESYTFVTLASLIYLWLGLLALLKRISVAWPALALSIAVMLHPQALFLGPSFIALLLWRNGFFSQPGLNPRAFVKELFVSGLVGGTCLGAFGLLGIMYNYSWQEWGVASKQFGGSDNGEFKPLLASAVRAGSREFYPILSWDWLVFQFNLQMRLAPLALPLIGLSGGWILATSKSKTTGGGGLVLLGWGVVVLGLGCFGLGLVWIGSQAVLWVVVLGMVIQLAGLGLVRHQPLDSIGFFLAIAAVYTWIFSLAWNPDLGSNDWDLLSLNGIFTSILAGYLVTKTLGSGSYTRFGRMVTALLTCALALQTGWVLYNTNFFRS